MMNFLRKNNIGFYVSSFLCLLVVLGSVISCTEKDEAFGNDMIPPDQLMGSSIDSTIDVHTYIVKEDSLDTNISNYYNPFMGSYIDQLVGRTDVQVFVNYSPLGFEHQNEFNYFGDNPKIDSMRYAIAFSNAIGDTSQSVWIDVYEVKGRDFHQYESYYNTFDMDPYIEDGEPLFSFEQKGTKTAMGKLEETPKNIEFINRFLDNRKDDQNIYYNDTVFHESFPGLYFKLRASATSGEGQMFQLDFSQSVMNIFYHNTGPGEPDTLAQQILFYREGDLGVLTYDYISFSTIQHDYSSSFTTEEGAVKEADILEADQEINDNTEQSEYMYIQGLAGLMGKLEIDPLSLDALKKKAKGLGYTDIALHRADLHVKMVNPSAVEYNNAGKSFHSLGIYFDMMGYEFLTEYQPILDGYNGYTTTLGGAVNRSTGVYSFDITSYVQRLLTGRETRYQTELQSPWGSRNVLGRSWVYGSESDYAPKLILTYTMIK